MGSRRRKNQRCGGGISAGRHHHLNGVIFVLAQIQSGLTHSEGKRFEQVRAIDSQEEDF